MQKNRATLEKVPADVAGMFDEVAGRYDYMNSVLSLGIDQVWRDATIEAVDPRPGMRILDLAAGTGTSSQPLADRGAQVYPTDLSLGMLRVGKRRQSGLHFVAGDALALPYADHSFDAVTISFGLRNVHNTVAALRELRRVTRPGGHLVVTEFSTPTPAPLRLVYQRGVLAAIPLVAKLSSNPPAYAYLGESILNWPNQPRLADLMVDAGWEGVAWRNLSRGIVAIHRGWSPR